MNISCKDNENFEFERRIDRGCGFNFELSSDCLLYTSDAADE